LIARARIFRIVLDTEALWHIHPGNAMGGKVKSNDIIANKLAGFMIRKLEEKMIRDLKRSEKQIEGMPLAEQVNRKHGFRVPLAELSCLLRADAGSAASARAVLRKFGAVGEKLNVSPGIQRPC